MQRELKLQTEKEIEGEKGKREKKFHLTAYQEKQSFCKFKVFFTEEYKQAY